MNTQFPPSSPIANSHHFDDENPFYQPEKDVGPVISSPRLDLFKGKDISKDGAVNNYPTPHPSSTAGRSSSPVRRQVDETPSSDYEVERHLETELKRASLIDIALDPRDSSRLAIGRKKSVCDIHLPRGKNISRQHAFISYITASNQVKLECNGTNGLVISFPRKLPHVFIKRAESSNVYELVTEDKSIAEEVISSQEKELLKSTSLTSFVLLKGESVIMPFFKDTIVDFRQCEARLSLQDITTDEEDAKNETETEDEMTRIDLNSDGFHEANSSFEGNNLTAEMISFNHIERSPPTPKCRNPSLSLAAIRHELPTEASDGKAVKSKVTPYSSFTLKTPMAPKKAEASTMAKEVSTPTKVQSESAMEEVRRRKLNSPSPKKKSKKKSKKQGVNDEATKEQILSSLVAKGVDYKELQHVLANHLAFSNVQQVPLFQLQDVNSIVSKLNRAELRTILNDEQCIGVIYRTGKDAAGKPLDEEFYYDAENDPDIDRRQLVASLKGGRSGLRSCRRVHKQYFWKKPTK
ncbi:unnamed protein product [Kluyveromyces dobzhanskii CBS 2104]|uniref:WGS project CCBQ000000000 data, contig MAT n=1 Tax=Kluyveromyces dobzhanskii CBS 2104 TaxID=1427455 RepID=A0A0A8L3F1_9SACH|nr:unnamed protein product [Kluyveromyces dobzhanskii CBS 2104]